MNIQIVKADSEKEADMLALFDKLIFSRSDWFPPDNWRRLECFWLLVDGKQAGSIGMRPDLDLISGGKILQIVTTGILPEFQGKGFGNFIKRWQVGHARMNGFRGMVTRARASNTRSIGLNKKFGFKATSRVPHFYGDPVEDAIVLELVF